MEAVLLPVSARDIRHHLRVNVHCMFTRLINVPVMSRAVPLMYLLQTAEQQAILQLVLHHGPMMARGGFNMVWFDDKEPCGNCNSETVRARLHLVRTCDVCLDYDIRPRGLYSHLVLKCIIRSAGLDDLSTK